ncbi:MAG: hypothetical protein AYK22_05235 [Thermoplasmatales archaeon SG8-52-3]|nr:MAG: hypothetical protein AYK22_05235 [Thermoplasmatales archaeon SG8-52-3]
MNKFSIMLYKILGIGVIILFVVMSVGSSTGNLISEKYIDKTQQKTEVSTLFKELLLIDIYNDLQQIEKRNEISLLLPVINFPLPGEVFRTGDIIEVNGTVSIPDFQNYIIEWGIGLNPTEWYTDGVTLIHNGTLEIINGTLGFWDTDSITDAEFYSIKLAVNLMDSEQYDVNVSIYLDPTLHINFPFGWPHEIQGSQVAIWSPIALSDINNDGYQEIGFGTVTIGSVGDNNNDYVIDYMGNILQGWPIQMYAIQGASLTFANLDNSTINEEVIGGMWGNKIYVWYDNGTLVDGWPKNIYASRATPSVSDIDCDGDLEIILPTVDGGGLIYVLHHNGNIVDGWPVSIGSPVRRGASIADIDKDGFAEILFGDQNGFVHALHHDGSYVDGWPQQAHDLIKSSPVIADIEGDGDLEIIICSGFTQQRIISIWHHDGTMAYGWPQENGLSFVQPSVGDIDNDGDLEILAGGSIPNKPYARFFVWHHDGTLVDGWPIKFPWDGSQNVDYIYAQPVIGDIDGDADVEIIVGSYKNKLYAWHHNAKNVTGWPKIIGDSVDSTAAIGDIDNDNLVEVAVAGDDGKIYVWDLEAIYNSSNMQWPMFQYDKYHTGYYRGKTGNNTPPTAPTIDGPTKCKPFIDYNYTFTATDPNGDDIWYHLRWGDNERIHIYGPYPSGEELILSNNWTDKGTYKITCWAKDIYDAVSDVSKLEVKVPRSMFMSISWFNCFFERFQILDKLLGLIKY